MSSPASEVTVRAIAAGGDGVGTLSDGRTVFIPRAAPGDRLRLRDVQLHKRFARARIEALLKPGPNRVTPPCPHYLADHCGSCQLMHLSVEGQVSAKSRIVGDALRRIARLDVSDPDVIELPALLGYRNKVTFASAGGHLGYHPVGDADHVFDVSDCLLAEPELQRLFRAVFAVRDTLPSAGVRVVLRRDRQGQPHVIVRTEPDVPVWGGAARLDRSLRDAGWQVIIWWHPSGGQPRALAGSEDPWPATVFEQVNPAVAARVRAAAIESLGTVAGVHLWDLYAGIGETTRALLERGASVESVEYDARAVALAERVGPSGPRRLAGRVEELAACLGPPEAIVTNPPRVGMAAAVVSALAASGAGRIAYISCDPATLARDLAGLMPRYRLARVLAFDQFPQTAHVETLAVLEQR